MNEKLINMEKEAGVNVSDGQISQYGKLSLSGVDSELVQAHNVPDNAELLSAAKAVIERWDSPLWKDLPHTGEAINRLRKAIEAIEKIGE